MPAAKRTLKAVLFDIDDTLFSTTTLATSARRNAIAAMQRHGLKGDGEKLYQELMEVIQEFTTNYEQHFDKLLQRVPASSFAGINPGILVAAGMVAYHDTKFRYLKIYDDAAEVLRRIHEKTELRMGIISSGVTIKQTEKIIRLGIYEFLDPGAIFISEQLGVNKPNPKIYQTACTAMHLPPEECMYIGDNPDNDVYPTKEVGMVACWHRRSGRWDLDPKKPKPDFEIRNFHELQDILVKDFGVSL